MANNLWESYTFLNIFKIKQITIQFTKFTQIIDETFKNTDQFQKFIQFSTRYFYIQAP